MNIFKAWKVWRKVSPLVTLVKEARMSGKPWWKSKTILANILIAAIELSGVLGGIVPLGTLQLVTNVLNVCLRLITNEPVTILPVSTDDD
jgi:hypothetical protein